NQHVFTDPTRITQIIYNLVGNGIKFTMRGSVNLTLQLIARTQDTMKVRFSVTDTGIGISAEKHQVIFEPFTQPSTNTTRNFGGTGLGLSIVKQLLVLFNSNIHLESTPGSGSRFFFDVLFKTEQIPAIQDKTGLQPNWDLTGLRLLAAEDNPMNAFL